MTLTADFKLYGKTSFNFNPDNLETVPIREVLRTTYSTSDFPSYYMDDDEEVDWAHIITAKASNNVEATWNDLHPDDLDYKFCALLESLMEHGMTHGVAWKSGYLYNGHHRTIAAILLGWDELPLDYYGSWEEQDWPDTDYVPPEYDNPQCD